MKKGILYLATCLTLLVSQACKKTNNSAASASETLSVSLSRNQTYKYTLPASESSAHYTVKTVGASQAVASIVSDASGSTFVYTPAENFSGKDLVVISTEPMAPHADGGTCQHNGCGHKQGGGTCDGSSKKGHSITFDITIAGQLN